MFGDSSYIFSLSFLRKDLVKDAIVAARSLSPPYGYIEGRVVSYKERKITILLEGDRKLTDNLEV